MKTGDYARTKDGIIGKLQIEKENIAVANWNGDYELEEITKYTINDNRININEIVKSSPNIIDLIEVGDYVNGERVNYIDDCKGAMREFYYIFEEVTHDVGHYEEEIESIVTKEQFEQMEYKIGGNE